ncbi:MAG: hypothetical protein QXJ19_06340 [Candidatus Bathyarchaeia archaeon]
MLVSFPYANDLFYFSGGSEDLIEEVEARGVESLEEKERERLR